MEEAPGVFVLEVASAPLKFQPNRRTSLDGTGNVGYQDATAWEVAKGYSDKTGNRAT